MQLTNLRDEGADQHNPMVLLRRLEMAPTWNVEWRTIRRHTSVMTSNYSADLREGNAKFKYRYQRLQKCLFYYHEGGKLHN